MKKIVLFLAMAAGYCGFAQKLKNVNIKYMMSGYIYAASSVEETAALGEFGDAVAAPKKMYGGFFPNRNGFFMHIDHTKIVPLNKKYTGYRFYMANKSDSIMWFEASDSRIDVFAEAYIDGKWQPIEFLPQSWCGNSYHRVSLKAGEYWEFIVPKYTGKQKVRVRYALKYGKDSYIYSNDVEASINREQLTVKEEYTPNSIMDPYQD